MNVRDAVNQIEYMAVNPPDTDWAEDIIEKVKIILDSTCPTTDEKRNNKWLTETKNSRSCVRVETMTDCVRINEHDDCVYYQENEEELIRFIIGVVADHVIKSSSQPKSYLVSYYSAVFWFERLLMHPKTLEMTLAKFFDADLIEMRVIETKHPNDLTHEQRQCYLNQIPSESRTCCDMHQLMTIDNLIEMEQFFSNEGKKAKKKYIKEQEQEQENKITKPEQPYALFLYEDNPIKIEGVTTQKEIKSIIRKLAAYFDINLNSSTYDYILSTKHQDPILVMNKRWDKQIADFKVITQEQLAKLLKSLRLKQKNESVVCAILGDDLKDQFKG